MVLRSELTVNNIISYEAFITDVEIFTSLALFRGLYISNCHRSNLCTKLLPSSQSILDFEIDWNLALQG